MAEHKSLEEHLPSEKLAMLLRCELKGRELIDALTHIETCEECSANLPPESPDEILEKLLRDDEGDFSPENVSISVKDKKIKQKVVSHL